MRLDAIRIEQDVLETLFCVIVPNPGIYEGLFLRPIFSSDIVVNLIVRPLAIKGWVNVAKVNAFVVDVLTKDFQIVAIIEVVFSPLCMGARAFYSWVEETAM